MPVGYVDAFSKNELYSDTFNQTLDKGIAYIDFERKRAAYANQTGPVRRGVGVSLFWYNTAVWPIALETSACRMVMNQDGSIQLQVGETEIGQTRPSPRWPPRPWVSPLRRCTSFPVRTRT